MLNLDGRKVLVARVHEAIHVNGVGQISNPITKDSLKFLGSLELLKDKDGLYIRGKGFEVLVPTSNVISMSFELEA